MTHRDGCLAQIEALTPWSELAEALKPFYAKEARCRSLIGVDWTLRMCFTKQCFPLSDEVAQDALYGSYVTRGFVGIGLSRQSATHVTTLLKFRCRLEKNSRAKTSFETINEHLGNKGLIVKLKVIVAPPSAQK